MKSYIVPAILEEAAQEYPDNSALSLFEGEHFTYKEVQAQVEQLAAWLVSKGIEPGDRVALFSANQPSWGMIYLGVQRSGAVIVPILPDFSGEELQQIVAHSGAKMLFYSKPMESKIAGTSVETIEMESFYPLDLTIDDTHYQKAQEYRDALREESLASLIYTSGTTGKSKGVMLSHGNLARNVEAGVGVYAMQPGECTLSILPLAHTYECTVGMLHPMACKAHVVYLGRNPAPARMVKALAEVRPHMMLAVPMLIEKIYRNRIAPVFRKNIFMKALHAFPPTRLVLERAAGKKLMKLFGGRLGFFGIGGAPLAEDVEVFLRRANFPYAIGYGLTETSPLIAGAPPHSFPVHSTGYIIPGMEIRIEEDGELLVKGPTVMQGYYDDPELTAQVLDSEGWFSTGDLVHYDENGMLFIKGRKKNVIIGSNGENIYPEVIESLINEQPFVQESLVTKKGGQLVAMIHLNYDAIKEAWEEHSKNVTGTIQEYLEQIRAQVNKKVGAFSRISEVLEQKNPFVRTPTQKIKRFLYN